MRKPTVIERIEQESKIKPANRQQRRAQQRRLKRLAKDMAIDAARKAPAPHGVEP